MYVQLLDKSSIPVTEGGTHRKTKCPKGDKMGWETLL